MADPQATRDSSVAKEEPPLLAALMRHPLMPVLVGFLLTGVMGAYISNRFATMRQEEIETTQRRETRRRAVVDLSRLFSERLTRAEMLVAALEKPASPETIADVKRFYDEAETKWFLTRPEAMLLVKEVLGEDDYELLRADMDVRIAKKRMRPLHACLERAYAKSQSIGEGGSADEIRTILREGRVAELIQEARAGSEALVEGLYDLAVVAQLDPSDPSAIKMRRRVKERFDKVCP